jgi:flagellin
MADGFYVRHNVTAMFAHRQSALNNTTLTQALERLSSGYRINRASDDVAGLAVSEKLRTQVRGYAVAIRNIQDGMSLVQVAESGLQELHNIVQRMRELAVQSANGIYTDSDRSLIQQEVDQLLNEINRMQTSVEFNRLKLLDGTFSSKAPVAPGQLTSQSIYRGSIFFHVGANESQTIKAHIGTLSVMAMGLQSLFSSGGAVSGSFSKQFNIKDGNILSNGVMSQAKAESAIGIIDSAINLITRNRSTLGAMDNRLTHTLNYAGTIREQLQSSESRIRDADMASEIIEFTKAQVLVQASNAMLAQANLVPQNVLSLLG